MITHLPSSLRAFAASAAAPICCGEKPSRSFTSSTTTAPFLVDLSTFWRNFVVSVEMSWFSCLSFDLSASDSFAPARRNNFS